jgi:phosphoglycolate phosphatase
MIKPRLFIFDWDGTLMDSEHQIVHCMTAAITEAGLVAPGRGAIRGIIGLGLPEAIACLLPEHPGNIRERVRQSYARHFIAGAGGQSRLFPGARELLEGLHSRGYLLAIATGKSRAGLERVLDQTDLRSHFHISRCADETASKPDPRMLHEIVDELGIGPEHAIMIGDTTFDLEMASRANIRSIGIGHGVHDVAALERHGPLTVVPDLSVLAPYLASL